MPTQPPVSGHGFSFKDNGTSTSRTPATELLSSIRQVYDNAPGYLVDRLHIEIDSDFRQAEFFLKMNSHHTRIRSGHRILEGEAELLINRLRDRCCGLAVARIYVEVHTRYWVLAGGRPFAGGNFEKSSERCLAAARAGDVPVFKYKAGCPCPSQDQVLKVFLLLDNVRPCVQGDAL